MKINVGEANVIIFSDDDSKSEWVDSSVASEVAEVTLDEYISLSNSGSLNGNVVYLPIPPSESLMGNVDPGGPIVASLVWSALTRTVSGGVPFNDADIRTLAQCCNEKSSYWENPSNTAVSFDRFYNTKRIFKQAVSLQAGLAADGITSTKVKNTYIQHIMPDRSDISEIQFFSTFNSTSGTDSANVGNGSNTHIWLTSTTTPGWEYLKLRPNLNVDHYVRITNSAFPSQQLYSLESRIDVGGNYMFSNIAFGANVYFNGPLGFRHYPMVFYFNTAVKSDNVNAIPMFSANAFMTTGSGSATQPERTSVVINVNGGWDWPILHTDNGLSSLWNSGDRRIPHLGMSGNVSAWYSSFQTNVRSTSVGTGLLDDGSEKYIFDNLSRNNLTPGLTASYGYCFFVCGTLGNKTSNNYKIIPYGNACVGYRDDSGSNLAHVRGIYHGVQVSDTRGGTFNRDHIWVCQGTSSLPRSQGSRYSILVAASVSLNDGTHYNFTRFRNNAVPRVQLWSRDVTVYNNGTKCNVWITGIGDDGHSAATGTIENPQLVFGEIEYESQKSDVFIARHNKSDGSITHFNIISSRPTEMPGNYKPRWTIRCARNNTVIGAQTAYISSATNNDNTYMDLKFIIYDKSRVIPGFFLFSTSNLLSSVSTVFTNRAGPATNVFCSPTEIVSGTVTAFGGVKYNLGANLFTIKNMIPYSTTFTVPQGPPPGSPNHDPDVNYTVQDVESTYLNAGGGIQLRNDIQAVKGDANVFTSAGMIVTNYLTLTDIRSTFSRNRIY